MQFSERNTITCDDEYKPSQAPVSFCNTLCNHCRCFHGIYRECKTTDWYSMTCLLLCLLTRWALRSFSEWTTSANNVRIAIYEVLCVYGCRFKPNTSLSICDCKLTIALLKLSKDLCMQLIHEAGWGVPQQVITTAQAVRKQVKQIQAGFEQEFFARLPIYRLPLIHK